VGFILTNYHYYRRENYDDLPDTPQEEFMSETGQTYSRDIL